MIASLLTLPYKDPLYPGLKLVGKRYVLDESSKSGLTVLFTHGIGSHKEVWEPVIATLLIRHAVSAGEATRVREAWSFDWQSHGEAAEINDAVLHGVSKSLSVRTWADGLRAFLGSGHLAGHTLVMVGHSTGATAWVLSTLPSFPARNDTNLKAIILVEPSLISRSVWNSHLEERKKSVHLMQQAISRRRDHWSSRAEAHQYFARRIPWKTWDPRALDLYVAHGLKDMGAPQDSSNKITLRCTKMLESAAYADADPHFAALEHLISLDPSLSVHCILAEKEDAFVPQYAHDSLIRARPMMSIQYIPDAGHMVVQENPEGVAACISEVLSSLSGRSLAKL